MSFSCSCIEIAQAAGLPGGKRSGVEILFRCPGPGHTRGDQHPSLSVSEEKNTWFCGPCNQGGNPWQLAAFLAGVSPDSTSAVKDWLSAHGFPNPSSNGNGNGQRASGPIGLPSEWRGKPIKEIYDYTDASGKLLYQVCRVEYLDESGERKKEFPVRCKGSWGLKGKNVDPVLYRLPRIVDPKTTEVHVVEGEQCVHAAESMRLVATSSAGGAGKWKSEYAESFRGDQRVVILPDNDEPGRKHAEQVARSLYGKVASLKVIHLAGLGAKGDIVDWLQGRDPVDAAEELSTIIDRAPEWAPAAGDGEETAGEPSSLLGGWELRDLGTVEAWETEPLEWDLEPLIPRRGIGFMSAPPKDRKSLLTLDLVIHWAQAHIREVHWLGRFRVAPRRVLYVAREDPARRLKERALEINASYGYPPIPEGVVVCLVRERFHLTNAEHTDWLREEVTKRRIDVLILDVLNRMVPDLDELNAKDMAVMVSILEVLNRDLGITILCLDHTRKPMNGPKSGRDRQEPNPFDLKGSVAKYGCADFMLCLARTEEPGRLQMYCENKDTDERPHFLVDVSPKGSTEPKFRFAGDIERFANDMKAKGDANRNKVLEALSDRWMTPAEIAEATGLAAPTVRQHLARLHAAGKAQRDGRNKGTRWRGYIAEGVQERFSDMYGDAHE